MTEDFLHYIWRQKKFKPLQLSTIEGEPLVIHRFGYQNHDAGPDFSDARVQIGDQLWVGNIEIHVRSSDWNRHAHQDDRAYNNVILHVVYEHDSEVQNARGIILPTLSLQGRFDESLYWRYERLLNNQSPIPCQRHLPTIDPFIVEKMLETVSIERLSSKAGIISGLMSQNQNDWNATFYHWLCRGFGLKINEGPMEVLARHLSWVVVHKHQQRIDQLEALFFGTAGMLEEPKDDYSRALAREYRFLSHKYNLKSMEPSVWKFARLRPAAFPSLRMAQLAALICKHANLFSQIIQTGTIEQMYNLLSVEVTDYWNHHYRLGSFTEQKIGEIGTQFRDILVINVIIPFLFVYGLFKDEPFYKQRAIDLLDQMKAENNKVVRMYKELGFPIKSALDSQAVAQLSKHYCKPKKCLNCAIGTDILKKKDDQ